MVPTTPSASPPLPHVLVVDDEAEIADAIVRYFGRYGFRVSAAGDGTAMREILQRDTVDVVLLDLGLPSEDGFELTRWLRERWRGAIIIVTGRGESVDRVVGLELGADDYVTKPFDLRELLARVRSVLRRMVAATSAPETSQAGYTFCGFRLDLDRRTLADAHGADVSLTSGEFDLLCVLVRHPNRVLSRDQLMNEMHGRASGPFDRAIDVQIGRLRRKIEADPSHPQLIKSVRNAGYLLAARVDRN